MIITHFLTLHPISPGLRISTTFPIINIHNLAQGMNIPNSPNPLPIVPLIQQ